jgi:hypothetical protein
MIEKEGKISILPLKLAGNQALAQDKGECTGTLKV